MTQRTRPDMGPCACRAIARRRDPELGAMRTQTARPRGKGDVTSCHGLRGRLSWKTTCDVEEDVSCERGTCPMEGDVSWKGSVL